MGPHEPRASPRGSRIISSRKPPANNCYRNLFVTQALFHGGGDVWMNWNLAMRDKLVQSQEAGKDEKVIGSWFRPHRFHGPTRRPPDADLI